MTAGRPAVTSRAFVRALVAVALALAGLIGAPPPVDAQTPSGPGAGDPSLLRLLGRSPWVGDGFDFVLSVQAVAAPPEAQVQVTVHDRVRNRTQFADSLRGEGLRRRLSGPSPVPLSAVDPDGDGTFSLLVPIVAGEGRQPVVVSTPGVYPVVVDLLDPEGDVVTTLRTHLVRLAGLDPAATDVPLGVAVVVPLGGPPSNLRVEAPGPADLDPSTVAAITNLTAALVAQPGVPISLHAVPESLTAVAGARPDLVTDLAAALGTSEVLARPWVPIDEAAWEAADPAVLTRLLTRGREQLAALLGILPSTSRLLGDDESQDEAAVMVAHGASALVVGEERIEAPDPDDFPYTVARPFLLALDGAGGAGAEDDEGGGGGGDGTAAAGSSRTVPALAADAALARAAAGAEDDPILAAHHVLADLAVIAADEPESARAVTLVLPRVAASSPEFLAELLAGLVAPPAPPAPPPTPVDPDADPAVPVPPAPTPIPAAAPLLRPLTVEAVLAAVEPAGAEGGVGRDDPLVRRLVERGTVADLVQLPQRLAAVRADLASYRSVFGPDATSSRLEVVLATTAAESLDAAARRAAFTAVTTTITDRLAGLGPPERQQVSLTDRDGRIQLVLANDTGAPADIVLHLRGDRLIFPDAVDGLLPVHLPVGATRLDLDVRARSSGDAPIDIRVTSPDGRIDLGSSRITVRTTAISGVGIALMVAAAGFLSVWWTRTILREHRSARRRHPTHLRAS